MSVTDIKIGAQTIVKRTAQLSALMVPKAMESILGKVSPED